MSTLSFIHYLRVCRVTGCDEVERTATAEGRLATVVAPG